MDLIWQKFTDWLKEILIGGITDALSGLFDTVNTRVGEIAGQVGATPQGWNGGIYNMIRSLSDNVILPIAGVILAIVMTMELIQIITDKNNMHGEVDTWFIFKSKSSFALNPRLMPKVNASTYLLFLCSYSQFAIAIMSL